MVCLWLKLIKNRRADRAPVRLCSEAFLAGALDRRNRGILVAAFPLHGPRHEASHAGDHVLPRQASRQQVLMQQLSLIALLGILLNTHHFCMDVIFVVQLE
ncbi:hypothetical protein CEXT_360161 [Caerostris extrusa]|uniref:Uncharacterized protein n=1 Tax=Caerostris extrusa TaxID=172846 RepID=A0AAV4UJ59_CAEEX|nr:hypothetical protein CEXT_360161 [Caerostris extrusa]